MRITENRLRRIIRQVIKESYHDQALLSAAENARIEVTRAIYAQQERGGDLYNVAMNGVQKLTAAPKDVAHSYVLDILDQPYMQEYLMGQDPRAVTDYLISTAGQRRPSY